MAGVRKDWRKRKPGTHTKEVHSEHLPDDIRKALVTIMERILALEEGHKASAELQTTTAKGLLELRQDLANVKAVMGKVGEEAERKLLGRVA